MSIFIVSTHNAPGLGYTDNPATNTLQSLTVAFYTCVTFVPSDGLDFAHFDSICGQDCDCRRSQGMVCQIRHDSRFFCHL